MVAALLALTAALAAPPPPPAPFQPAPEECPVADIQRDQALPPELAGDVATCDGVLLPRAYLLNYEQAAQDAELLRATWPPDPELPPGSLPGRRDPELPERPRHPPFPGRPTWRGSGAGHEG